MPSNQCNSSLGEDVGPDGIHALGDIGGPFAEVVGELRLCRLAVAAWSWVKAV